MEGFVKGEIVILPFPFSDLSAAKKRPALIISTPKGEDLILIQITSNIKKDKYSIKISNDFKEGSLPTKSVAKINRIFSADKKIILYKKGKLKQKKINEIENRLIDLIKN